MKFLVMLGDGMADTPVPALNDRTPLEAAEKPVMDALCKEGLCGLVTTVPEGMVPESDTANLAVLGYDPRLFSKGRSPLEAASMGLSMREDDVAFRCNVVTLSEEGDYAQKRLLDHSADEISTEEAGALIATLNEALGTEARRFYTGVSYRHCLLWENPPAYTEFARPHDILDESVGAFLPREAAYRQLMEESFAILDGHPVNERRRRADKRPANSIWLWSPGKKPSLPSFQEKFGVQATVISAVDLMRGMAICADMDAPKVAGATGTFTTDYGAKARAAMDAFCDGSDLVYIHVEAPDECGHRAEIEHKVSSIEKIDAEILAPVKAYLDQSGEPYRILLLPDHPTPIAARTHTRAPVPFVLYDSELKRDSGIHCYCERAFANAPHIEDGTRLMPMLIET